MIPEFKDRNLFFAFSTFTGERAVFDKWYDEEHIPQVTDATGMVGAQRFVVADTKPLNGTEPIDYGHLAMYELEGSPAAFREEVKEMLMSGEMVLPDFMVQPFKALFLEPLSPPQYGDAAKELENLDDRHLWLVFSRPPADRATFEKWYDEEHIPDVLSAPGLVRAQRFGMSPVKPLPGVVVPECEHLAVYEIAGDPGPLREHVKQQLISGEMVLPDFMNQSFPAMFLRPVSPFWLAAGALQK
ncbi:hypothetical protein FOS14_21425 [Skermania sp. ID1734]|uniref:hypothetical protein n=1 Tax=Skermania sp. ID1734 TaxID=2597516 RepID=UPI00117F116F|nr:hypothetical protein [Skermania sp. ID1734]TSD94090.1 hypothetical protein FOS14_21425 [Skermania sp. ID1734]